MNTLAEELNALLQGSVADRLMSRLGRSFYFPNGIIAQSAEAKKSASLANATIGMAYQNGKPLMMSAIADNLPNLTADETVIYAPTAGVEKTRAAWKQLLIQKNPSINPDSISLPIVVPGITAGISYTAELFLDTNQRILTSGPCWDNYGLIFQDRRGGSLVQIPFFGPDLKGALDLETIGRAIREEAKTGTVRIILNFPNNPSGYSPTNEEADALIGHIREAAESGADVLVLCDDAYFGLFYEPGIIRESLFGKLATLHERVLAVKIDGPTKEDYAWGFRMAFVTLGCLGLKAEAYEALIKKYMGLIRSSVSCANTPAQFLALKTIEDPRTSVEKDKFFNLLQNRYRRVKEFIEKNPPHPVLEPLPFNSGYFMCFRCNGVDAETLRRELLAKDGVGAIALEGKYLRLTFAAIEEEVIPQVLRAVYDRAEQYK